MTYLSGVTQFENHQTRLLSFIKGLLNAPDPFRSKQLLMKDSWCQSRLVESLVLVAPKITLSWVCWLSSGYQWWLMIGRFWVRFQLPQNFFHENLSEIALCHLCCLGLLQSKGTTTRDCLTQIAHVMSTL